MSSLPTIKNCFDGRFQNRTVLVTGHTGFKGSWLCMWLKLLGARVVGYSLAPPTAPSHWELLDLDCESHIADIRDLSKLKSVMSDVQPDLVMHLAAQALVRQGYADPIETISSNVMGTTNVLEAARNVSSIRAILCVTSDKVYANLESNSGYEESARLGGADPYSCSKACTELIVNSYRESWFSRRESAAIATARAGNVIGGGDWSLDRLIPDAIKAAVNGNTLQIRNPNAVRPWQHVLEPLAGYLMFADQLLAGNTEVPLALNFGPTCDGNVSVSDVVDEMQKSWANCGWESVQSDADPHETKLLKLNSQLARTSLNWLPVWDWRESVARTTSWYKDWNTDQVLNSEANLLQFVRDAKVAGLEWAA